MKLFVQDYVSEMYDNELLEQGMEQGIKHGIEQGSINVLKKLVKEGINCILLICKQKTKYIDFNI